jgi:hypothetical protein
VEPVAPPQLGLTSVAPVWYAEKTIVLEGNVGDLQHQIKMLLWDMKCSGVKPSKLKNGLLSNETNETNETCLHSTTQEEPLEVLDLDEIYK